MIISLLFLSPFRIIHLFPPIFFVKRLLNTLKFYYLVMEEMNFFGGIQGSYQLWIISIGLSIQSIKD